MIIDIWWDEKLQEFRYLTWYKNPADLIEEKDTG